MPNMRFFNFLSLYISVYIVYSSVSLSLRSNMDTSESLTTLNGIKYHISELNARVKDCDLSKLQV